MLLIEDTSEAVSAEVIGEAVLSLPTDMRRHVLSVLQQAEDDAAWAEQIGPAYTRKQVAHLLGVSTTAVAKNSRLLELEQRSGTSVYPVVQFDGDRISEDVGAVVRLFAEVVETPWTTASWLTSARPELDGLRPIDVLTGSQHKVDLEPRAVMDLALDAAHAFAPNGWRPTSGSA